MALTVLFLSLIFIMSHGKLKVLQKFIFSKQAETVLQPGPLLLS
jgi:hypothetical protein